MLVYFCAAIIFGAFFTSDAYLMLIKRESKSQESYLRGSRAYLKSGNSLKLTCSFPNWVNVSDYSLPIRWSLVSKGPPQSGKIFETNRMTLTEPNTYMCMPPLVDGKQKDKLENTSIEFFKADSQITISASYMKITDYNITNPDIVISCNHTAGGKVTEWLMDDTSPALRSNVKQLENNTLIISRPTYKDVGIYMCKINNDLNFVSIEGPAFIPIKHGKHDDSENKIEGGSVTIVHEVYGNPYPDEVVWKVSIEPDGEQTVIDKQYLLDHPNVRFSPSTNVSNGVLEILNLEKSNRAHYSSFAKNNIGSTESSFRTLIRVKGKLDALWPFLGIVAEVLILVAIILIYERRRLKQEQEPEEAHDQKKPLTSTNSESVRQRKN